MEYKTSQLSGFPPKAETQINELAKDGWELIVVSFNVGYFRRPEATVPVIGTIKGVSNGENPTKLRRKVSSSPKTIK
jgi:hypothetical protein